jgi:hypothetical protein
MRCGLFICRARQALLSSPTRASMAVCPPLRHAQRQPARHRTERRTFEQGNALCHSDSSKAFFCLACRTGLATSHGSPAPMPNIQFHFRPRLSKTASKDWKSTIWHLKDWKLTIRHGNRDKRTSLGKHYTSGPRACHRIFCAGTVATLVGRRFGRQGVGTR